MKSVILLLECALALVVSVSAQPPIAEWREIQKIKPLEATREVVHKVLLPISFSASRNEYEESFYLDESVVRVRYANGTCAGAFEEWDVPDGTVTEVRVAPKNEVPIARIGIDYSAFRKQRTDPQRKNIYVRYDKGAGIAISFFVNRLDSIYLFPSKQDHSRLCKNPEVRNYYKSNRWSRKPVPKNLIIDY